MPGPTSYNMLGIELPIQGARAMTVDVTIVSGRAIRLTASAAGTVVVTFQNTTTDTFTLAVGDNVYPGAYTKYASGGGATITSAAIWD